MRNERRINKKNITLIALVVIIVLLILVGVAISQLAGENSNAGNDNNSIPSQKQTLLSTVVQPGDYITYNPELGVATEDKATLLNYTSPVGTFKVKNSNNEYVVKEEKENTFIYNGAYNLLNANGEFIISDEYTVDTNGDMPGNGHNSQSFTAEGASTVWRVLDVNETTGVIKIIPEEPIRTTENNYFYLKGLRGYRNAVTELNNISSIFGHGQGANGAASITVEDINTLTGYEVKQPTKTIPIGSTGSWYNTYYSYKKDSISDTNIQSMIFKDSYWVASTCVHAGSYSAGFSVRCIYKDTLDYCCQYTIGKSIEMADFSNYGILPVVSLKTDVMKLGGTGEKDSPWIFQITK